MRDAFGGTFMFKIIIIFIVFYVTFMAIAANYAKVFKIKNNVINILEQSQFNYNDANDWNGIVNNGKISTYLSSVAYNHKDNDNIVNDCRNRAGQLSSNGVCIRGESLGKSSAYYEVTVYMVVSFPLFSIDFVIPISGETETVNFQ